MDEHPDLARLSVADREELTRNLWSLMRTLSTTLLEPDAPPTQNSCNSSTRRLPMGWAN